MHNCQAGFLKRMAANQEQDHYTICCLCIFLYENRSKGFEKNKLLLLYYEYALLLKYLRAVC